MRTETHGDFTQRSWSDTYGQRHCEVTHVPTGLKSASMSHGIYTDEIDAWKGMAMKLGERLASRSTDYVVYEMHGPKPAQQQQPPST